MLKASHSWFEGIVRNRISWMGRRRVTNWLSILSPAGRVPRALPIRTAILQLYIRDGALDPKDSTDFFHIEENFKEQFFGLFSPSGSIKGENKGIQNSFLCHKAHNLTSEAPKSLCTALLHAVLLSTLLTVHRDWKPFLHTGQNGRKSLQVEWT